MLFDHHYNTEDAATINAENKWTLAQTSEDESEAEPLEVLNELRSLCF